jgi:hypothetical protein
VSANGFRIAALNGLLMIAAAMVLAGFPVIWAVGREVYHAPQPIALPGSYQAWLMAHVVGLMNGLVVIAVAQVTRLKPMHSRAEWPLLIALIVAGWGNTTGSIAAPLFGVRGVELDWDVANNVIVGLFGLATLAILYAVAVVIHHLWRPA